MFAASHGGTEARIAWHRIVLGFSCTGTTHGHREGQVIAGQASCPGEYPICMLAVKAPHPPPNDQKYLSHSVVQTECRA
jgi:hypothetical protein